MHKLRLVFFVAVLLGITALSLGFPLIGIILIFAFSLSILVYGSAFIGSQFFLNTLVCGEPENRWISLTFDDGPHAVITPEVLRILKKYGITGTFFMIGRHVDSHPEIVRRIMDGGHIAGNHSYSHGPLINFRSSRHWMKECRKTDNAIQRLTGKRPNLFRPPYGVTNPAIARMNKTQDYRVIGWSLRSMDTVIHHPGKLLGRLTKNVRNGDIILFHDTQARLPEVLEKFLDYCLQEKIQVVPLTQLLKITPYKK